MKDSHAIYYEGNRSQTFDLVESQKHLSEKAVDIYAVRPRFRTTPGESKTSPTLESGFTPENADASFDYLLIPTLPDAHKNPQDAVHRSNHPAAANGGRSRQGIRQEQRMRIAGAGGTNSQQVFQRQAHLNPISHPMAGGATPERIDLRQHEIEGKMPYFPMSSGQPNLNDPRVTPRNHKAFRDMQLRTSLDRNRPHVAVMGQMVTTQNNARSFKRGA
jgi:hypothetical protein